LQNIGPPPPLARESICGTILRYRYQIARLNVLRKIARVYRLVPLMLEYYVVIKEGDLAGQSNVIRDMTRVLSRADPDPDLHSHSGTTEILITSLCLLPLLQRHSGMPTLLPTSHCDTPASRKKACRPSPSASSHLTE
jgi:hypothetical protein